MCSFPLRRPHLGCLLVLCVAATASAEPETPAPGVAIGVQAASILDEMGQTRPISLAEAVDLALAENLDLALAKANEAIAQARAGAAVMGLVPSLGVDAGIGHTKGLVQAATGNFGDVEFGSHEIGAAVRYGVNLGAQIKAISAARKDLAAAVYNRLATEQQLILRVAELYENLVLAAISVDIAEQTAADSAGLEHIADVRAKGGIGLGADAARARALLAATKQTLVTARTLWKNTSVQLAVVLRLDPQVVLSPAIERQTLWSLASPQDLDHLALSARQRPDVEAARKSTDAAEARVEQAWWDLFGPRLDAQARYGGVGGHGDNPLPDGLTRGSAAAGSVGRSLFAWQSVAEATPAAFGLALSNAFGSGGRAAAAYRSLFEPPAQDFPGFDHRSDLGISINWNLSFAQAATIRENKRLKKQAELRATQLEEAAVGEVVTAAHDIQSASDQIALAQDELAAATDNHRMRMDRYRAGTALFIEVIDAEDAIEQARLHLARHITDTNLAQARILAAAGLIDRKEFGSETGESGGIRK